MLSQGDVSAVKEVYAASARRQIAIAVAILVPLVWTQAALADDAIPSEVRDATVIVTAKGIDTSMGNAPVASEATGFVINARYGWIVTAYGHLVSELKSRSVIRDALRPDAPSRRHRDRGCYRRKIPRCPGRTSWCCTRPSRSLASSKELTQGDLDADHVTVAATPVFDPGYPAGLDYNVNQGLITSLGGPVHPLMPVWTTSLTFKQGQSGSPIVLGNGHVLAFARAVDIDATQIGFVVPARYIPQQYWDGTARIGDTKNLAQAASTRVVVACRRHALAAGEECHRGFLERCLCAAQIRRARYHGRSGLGGSA